MASYNRSIPFEITNAKEWDPNRNLQEESSSEEWYDDEDDDDDEEDFNRKISNTYSSRRKVHLPEGIQDFDVGVERAIKRFQGLSVNPEIAPSDNGHVSLSQTRPSLPFNADSSSGGAFRESIGSNRPNGNSPSSRHGAPSAEGAHVYHEGVRPAVHHAKDRDTKLVTASLEIANTFPSHMVSSSTQPRNMPSQQASRNGPSDVAFRKSTETAIRSDDKRLHAIRAQALKGGALPRLPPGRRSSAHKKTLFDSYVKVNSSESAFRRRRAHQGVFHLHKSPIEIEADPERMYSILKRLGRKTGAFVRPPQTGEDRQLLIWGNPEQVTKTKTYLRDWIKSLEAPQSLRKLAKHNFSKEFSTASSKYRHANREIQRTAFISSLQQAPEPGRIFKYQGAYLWPIEDVEPQRIFGSNMEAFDPVRQQYQCHIIYVDALQAFRIYTDEGVDSVNKVLKRIEGALKDYHARNISGGRTWIENMIEPPALQALLADIKLLATQSVTGRARTMQIPELTGRRPDIAVCQDWPQRVSQRNFANATRIERTLQQVLPSLIYYRGQVRMRMLFGTFALTNFREPVGRGSTMPFEDFIDGMKEPHTKGLMLKDLRLKEDPETILSRIYALDHILETPDNQDNFLDQVARTYSIRFEIQRFEMPPAQLEVEVNSSVFEKELYSRTHTVWSRTKRKDDTIPLDIFMIRLNGGPSWKLQVSTENNYDPSRINSKMKDFEHSVKLMRGPRKATDVSGKRLFEWETQLPGSVQPSVVEQKTAWRFRLRAANSWMFEVARYDTYKLISPPPQSSTQRTNDLYWSDMPETTLWAACMWNADWDIELSKNASLGIGESADWDPSLDKFFPSGVARESRDINDVHPGVSLFLSHIRTVSEALDGICQSSSDTPDW